MRLLHGAQQGAQMSQFSAYFSEANTESHVISINGLLQNVEVDGPIAINSVGAKRACAAAPNFRRVQLADVITVTPVFPNVSG